MFYTEVYDKSSIRIVMVDESVGLKVVEKICNPLNVKPIDISELVDSGHVEESMAT